jgi:hypothetical protein
MFIPDPDFYPSRISDPGSRIQDPKTAKKERGEKKIYYHIFFCSHKFDKIEYYFIFEMLKKKIWANFPRIIEVFTQKIFTMLSNIWVWDPGVEKAPDPGSGSATLVSCTSYGYPILMQSSWTLQCFPGLVQSFLDFSRVSWTSPGFPGLLQGFLDFSRVSWNTQ